MRVHTRRAIGVIFAAVSLDMLMGWLFSVVEHISVTSGLYYAVTTASTVGYGDIVPTSPTGRLVTVVMEATVIPLFAAAYSLMTVSLTTGHIKRHIDKRHSELTKRCPSCGAESDDD